MMSRYPIPPIIVKPSFLLKRLWWWKLHGNGPESDPHHRLQAFLRPGRPRPRLPRKCQRRKNNNTEFRRSEIVESIIDHRNLYMNLWDPEYPDRRFIDVLFPLVGWWIATGFRMIDGIAVTGPSLFWPKGHCWCSRCSMYLEYMYLHLPQTWIFTLWLFHIAMENDPFIDDVPMKTSIYSGFSIFPWLCES